MNKAIEKAIKNGWDLKQFSEKSDKIDSWNYGGKTLALHPTIKGIYITTVFVGIYNLIFGTDFIDKLVSSKSGCVDRQCECFLDLPEKEWYRVRPSWGYCSMVNNSGCKRHGLIIDYRAAHQHLREISSPEISRDIKKLIEYVRKLV